MFGSLILYYDFFQARVRELCYGGSLQKHVDIIIALIWFEPWFFFYFEFQRPLKEDLRILCDSKDGFYKRLRSMHLLKRMD